MMIVSNLIAATLASTAPQAAVPAPAVDHSKMDHSKMDHGKSGAASPMKMDCCKDGCSCCAKSKDKPAS
jgi:uncharacterized protein involved in copper resistance